MCLGAEAESKLLHHRHPTELCTNPPALLSSLRPWPQGPDQGLGCSPSARSPLSPQTLAQLSLLGWGCGGGVTLSQHSAWHIICCCYC